MWDEIAELDDSGSECFFGNSHWNWRVGALMARMLIERLVADGEADLAVLDGLGTTETPRAPEGDLFRLLGLQRPELAQVIAFDRPDVMMTEEVGQVPGLEEARYTFTVTDSYLIPGRMLLARDSFADLTQLPQFFEDLTVMHDRDLSAPGQLALQGGYDRIIFKQVQCSSWYGFRLNPLIG